MNKSLEERGPDSFIQAHRRSPRVFFKFLEVKMWNFLDEQDSIIVMP